MLGSRGLIQGECSKAVVPFFDRIRESCGGRSYPWGITPPAQRQLPIEAPLAASQLCATPFCFYFSHSLSFCHSSSMQTSLLRAVPRLAPEFPAGECPSCVLCAMLCPLCAPGECTITQLWGRTCQVFHGSWNWQGRQWSVFKELFLKPAGKCKNLPWLWHCHMFTCCPVHLRKGTPALLAYGNVRWISHQNFGKNKEEMQELSCGKWVLGSYLAAGEHWCQGWRFQVCVS